MRLIAAIKIFRNYFIRPKPKKETPSVPQLLEKVMVSKPGHFGGGNWDIEGLTPITIIFGKNSSGKVFYCASGETPTN